MSEFSDACEDGEKAGKQHREEDVKEEEFPEVHVLKITHRETSDRRGSGDRRRPALRKRSFSLQQPSRGGGGGADALHPHRRVPYCHFICQRSRAAGGRLLRGFYANTEDIFGLQTLNLQQHRRQVGQNWDSKVLPSSKIRRLMFYRNSPTERLV